MTIATGSNPPVDTQPLLLDVSHTTLTVTPEQFDRLCIDNPDLRLELTPKYQRLGVRLGLPIDPQARTIEIYRPRQEPEIVQSPESIDCGDVMPGVVLSMSRIW